VAVVVAVVAVVEVVLVEEITERQTMTGTAIVNLLILLLVPTTTTIMVEAVVVAAITLEMFLFNIKPRQVGSNPTVVNV
jgi:hypothetical protein